MHKIKADVEFIPLDDARRSNPHPELVALYESGRKDAVLGRQRKLIEQLSFLDPIAVLGITAFYSGVWSHQSSIERKPAYELQIADLEFLQVLILRGEIKDNQCFPLPEELEKLWAEVKMQYFAETIKEPLDNLSPERQGFTEQLRLHSAFYRNPYGFSFFREMFVTLGEMLDALEGNTQVRCRSFATVIVRLIESINRKYVEVQEKIAQIYKTGIDLDAYAKSLSMATPQAQAFYDRYRSSSLDHETRSALCYNLVEQSFWQTFSFTRLEIENLGRDMNYAPWEDLSLCSCGFGHAHNLNLSSLWARPLIQHNEQLFLFSPYTLLTFPFHLLSSLYVRGSERAKASLEKIRGKYLETRAAELFRTAFPSADVWPNVFWFNEVGERIETDLIIRIGSSLIIAEAKGATFPDRLRNGSYAKAKTFLKSTLGAGNLQAARLKKRLAEVPELKLFDNKRKVRASLRGTDIKESISVVLTLEQLGTLANANKLLELAGIIGEDALESMPLMISELAYILQYLPNEITRLHYISRRSRVFSRCNVLGDEMDFFALYVMYGFSASIFQPGRIVFALGASYSLEKYRSESGSIIFSESSTTSNIPYFTDFLERLEDTKQASWHQIGAIILDMPPRQQREFLSEGQQAKFGRLLGKRRQRRSWEAISQSGISSALLQGYLGDIGSSRRDHLLRMMGLESCSEGASISWSSDAKKSALSASYVSP